MAAAIVHPGAVFLVVLSARRAGVADVPVRTMARRRRDRRVRRRPRRRTGSFLQAVQPMSVPPPPRGWQRSPRVAHDRAGARPCASTAILIRPNLASCPATTGDFEKGDVPFLAGGVAAGWRQASSRGAQCGALRVAPLATATPALFACRTSVNAPLRALGDRDAHAVRAAGWRSRLWALRRDRERARLAWTSLLCGAARRHVSRLHRVRRLVHPLSPPAIPRDRVECARSAIVDAVARPED